MDRTTSTKKKPTSSRPKKVKVVVTPSETSSSPSSAPKTKRSIQKAFELQKVLVLAKLKLINTLNKLQNS
jgi:hypothetical protein